MFALQVLGAAGQLERALIRERTLSGLAAARKRGRVGGNPGMRRGDKEAIAKIVSARRRTRLASLQALEREWLPHIKKMRPIYPWQDVLETVLATNPSRQWTLKSLMSAAKLYCQEGFLDTAIFKASALRRRKPQSRAFEAIVGMKLGDANITLAEIAAALTKGKFLTPTSQRIWTVSSVQKLVERARKTGRL